MLTPTKRNILQKLNKQLIALIIDEQSMLNAKTLGSLHEYCNITAHYGVKPNQDFGGIPIVLLLGDDGQLPPVKEGAFESIQKNTNNVLSCYY